MLNIKLLEIKYGKINIFKYIEKKIVYKKKLYIKKRLYIKRNCLFIGI